VVSSRKATAKTFVILSSLELHRPVSPAAGLRRHHSPLHAVVDGCGHELVQVAKSTSAAAERDPPKEGAASPFGAGSEARPRSSLGTGVVPQPFARIDWAPLIRRVYLEDVLRCPCGGRRRIHRSVTEPDAVVAILEHLGLSARAPPLSPRRGTPGWSKAA
jgi:hypothetical protein